MTERDLLVGRYNRTLLLQICNEIRAGGDIVGFCRRFLHDGECRVVRNALLCVSKAGKGEIASLGLLKDEFMDLAMGAVLSKEMREYKKAKSKSE